MRLRIPQPHFWVRLTDESGARLWARLFKGGKHKYIRRVPKGGGKKGYRYYYKVTGGKGLGHHDEFAAGAKFKLEHNGQAGHFEVKWARDGKVRVKHDESGHEVTMAHADFAAMLRDHHAEKVDAHAKRLRAEHKQAGKTGTAKQQARIKREAKKYGVALDEEKPAEKPAATGPMADAVAKYGFSEAQAKAVEASAKKIQQLGLAKDFKSAVERAAKRHAKKLGLSAKELQQRREAAKKRKKKPEEAPKPEEPKKPKPEAKKYKKVDPMRLRDIPVGGIIEMPGSGWGWKRVEDARIKGKERPGWVPVQKVGDEFVERRESQKHRIGFEVKREVVNTMRDTPNQAYITADMPDPKAPEDTGPTHAELYRKVQRQQERRREGQQKPRPGKSTLEPKPKKPKKKPRRSLGEILDDDEKAKRKADEPALGITKTPKGNVHRVKLADGSIATRTSKSREYSHVVVHTTTQEHVDAARKKHAEMKAAAEAPGKAEEYKRLQAAHSAIYKEQGPGWRRKASASWERISKHPVHRFENDGPGLLKVKPGTGVLSWHGSAALAAKGREQGRKYSPYMTLHVQGVADEPKAKPGKLTPELGTGSLRDKAAGLLGSKLLALEKEGWRVIAKPDDVTKMTHSEALGRLPGGKVVQLHEAGLDLKAPEGHQATQTMQPNMVDRDTMTWQPPSAGVNPRSTVTLKRGQPAWLWMSKDKVTPVKVVGFRDGGKKVRVSPHGAVRSGGFDVEYTQVYTPEEGAERFGKGEHPAVTEERAKAAKDKKTKAKLSKIIVKQNKEAEKAAKEVKEAAKKADALPGWGENPFKRMRSHIEDLNRGNVTAEQHRARFNDLIANRDKVVSALSRLTNKQLDQIGGWRYDRKAQKVKGAAAAIADQYHLGDTLSYGMNMTREQAIARDMAKLTDADIRAHADKKRAKMEARDKAVAARQKALTSPDTLDEFRFFERIKGRHELAPDQQRRYDQMEATASRQAREEARAKTQLERAAVKRVEGAGGMVVHAGVHTKKGHKIWTAVPNERVEPREKFLELKAAAQRLGGRYSSYRGGGAIPGFIFRDEESAHKFAGIGEQGADVGDKLAKRAEEKAGRKVDRLRAVADKAHADSKAELTADRQTNTARRASMAAGIRERAATRMRMAETARKIADAIDRGEAQHLKGLHALTHVEALDDALNAAVKVAVSREVYGDGGGGYRAYEAKKHRAPTHADVEAVQYPWPSENREHLDKMLTALKGKRGMKRPIAAVRAAMKEQAQQHKAQGDKRTDTSAHLVRFRTDDEREAFAKVTEAAKRYGVESGWYGGDSTDDFNRMRRMDIHTPAELREALREYMDLRGKRAEISKEQKVREKEQELARMRIPGYFPTPKGIVADMVKRAGIKEGHTVLEPSAGAGHIADAARAAGADVEVVEFNHSLREHLKGKGHNVVGNDTLNHTGSYDRVIMNPPFERGQDAQHVMHAFEHQLAPGGRLVAIMSEGPFGRSDSKSQAFRQWLDKHGGRSVKLPAGSFKSSDRQTGVNTRMVIIDRPGGATVKPAGGGLFDADALFGEGASDPKPESSTERGLRALRGAKVGDRITVQGREFEIRPGGEPSQPVVRDVRHKSKEMRLQMTPTGRVSVHETKRDGALSVDTSVPPRHVGHVGSDVLVNGKSPWRKSLRLFVPIGRRAA